MHTQPVAPVERVSVTTLIDNSLDHFLLESTAVLKRPLLSWSKSPVAEHGLSLLIEFERGGEAHTVLLDTGLSDLALSHNMDVLGLDPDRIEAVILSHGHMDHIGGLPGFLARTSRGCDLISHPGAYCRRRLNIPGQGPQPELPALNAAALAEAGATIRTAPDPTLWFSDMLLTLGEIERTTAFERGFPWAEIHEGGQWLADPFCDDQALVFDVAGKGLVVISGCAHAGIINSVRYAQKVTGTRAILAVMGGFHLTGPLFEPIVDQTVAAMRELAPAHLIPMHCTGWKSTHAFAAAMPGQFMQSSVGTRYDFT
ncbi:beta-lactamase domain protein [Solidesulfovibrio carbinoliphilus subsp. oakridgensis]|uniref:Beta-lactamase domain protein n=1 Tax=Solidesulfovibrio carbinoliphilus subsp. oakridgensis TaxID=694327 RepID=G7Q7B2_9BACT|nr:MBL fold metallo-hydrolase [Solidesulfovibrio carbinoliphilus]EHJ49069.1 beta-lactamase domain protein [Solidesulfovibrio carbinoliphilus subsp. oakridgensis]